MPRTRKPSNPWEPELLRVGRRLLRNAAETGSAIALGGFESLESAIEHTVAPGREARRLRLIAVGGVLRPDCFGGE
jgi:hypothetical protein